jgi:hypothetical protein
LNIFNDCLLLHIKYFTCNQILFSSLLKETLEYTTIKNFEIYFLFFTDYFMIILTSVLKLRCKLFKPKTIGLLNFSVQKQSDYLIYPRIVFSRFMFYDVMKIEFLKECIVISNVFNSIEFSVANLVARWLLLGEK